ncbi:hypothetical protein QN387_26220, partial [Pseudomonas sp. CCI3.1]
LPRSVNPPDPIPSPQLATRPHRAEPTTMTPYSGKTAGYFFLFFGDVAYVQFKDRIHLGPVVLCNLLHLDDGVDQLVHYCFERLV